VKYKPVHVKMRRLPQPKKASAMMGEIQWTSGRADHLEGDRGRLAIVVDMLKGGRRVSDPFNQAVSYPNQNMLPNPCQRHDLKIKEVQWTHHIGSIGAPILAMMRRFSGAMFALLSSSLALIDSFAQ
jgi:hypothetical protein